ncbi:unnamed protein product, partial [Adineta steineri]
MDYQMEKTSDSYSVRLIINGLEHEHSRLDVSLTVLLLKFFGPTLFGFYLGQWGYVRQESTLMSQTSSAISIRSSRILIKKLLTPAINPYRFSKIHNWAKQGKYFNFNGYPIFYYDSNIRDTTANSKPTLLLLHGYPTSSIDWLYMRDELEKRFHCIAPDYIGYGLSAKPVSFSYTIFSQVDMIEELMNSLQI